MPYTTVDDVSIYFEIEGNPADPAIVLISGGGAQLISWDDRLVALLVAEGFRVVRLDNRDTGLSQRFGGDEDIDGGYDLSDMAEDVLRVLDALDIPAAHLIGHSMGGMMAQTAAIEHPERVLSLGLLSTIPGQDPRYILHGERPELLMTPIRVSRDEAVAFARHAATNAAPSRYDAQVEWHAAKAALAYDRGYAPEGFSRQWAALRRAPERLARLAEVDAPALVWHGRVDDVLHWSAAVDMAEALTAAELQVHPEVGHFFPQELWPDLAAAITRTARRGEEHAQR